MPFCRECGYKMTDEATVCLVCGWKTGEEVKIKTPGRMGWKDY